MEKSTSNSEGYKSIWIRPSKGAASYLVRRIESGLIEGSDCFKIKLKDEGSGLYPNTVLPMAGMIDRYKWKLGCTFLLSYSTRRGTYADHVGLLHPYANVQSVRSDAFLDKIWRIDRHNQYEVVSGIVSSLRQTVLFAPGVLRTVELCLSEVTDNVLTHSGDEGADKPFGFVMVQAHRSSGVIAASVYDYGIGISASLASGGVQFEGTEDAILLALESGVTDGKGAGKGLWMLKSAVEQSLGSLEVVTNGIRYSCIHTMGGEIREAFSKVYSPIDGTTLVDFQIRADVEIDVDQIVGPDGPVDLWMEAREDENDENVIRLNVADEAIGLGSRYDGEHFRNEMLNVANSTQGIVVLDFHDVDVMSLSFADEMTRKAIEELGESRFNELFRFEGLNSACRAVVNEVLFRKTGR